MQRFDRRKGKLSADREAQLQALVDAGLLAWDVGTPIGATDEAAWNRHLDELVEFINEHGHSNLSHENPRNPCCFE